MSSNPNKRLLVIATSNRGKVLEFQSLLAPGGYTLLTPKDIGFRAEIEETGDTFFQNALIKAKALSAFTSYPVLADDSGLEVDALNGAPGVYSARYASELLISPETGKPIPQDAANRLKLLSALNGEVKRKARFRCILCFLLPGLEAQFFAGVCEGSIAEGERGMGGFGYDPLFIPAGYTQSFGELSHEVKDSLSHRAKATRLFLESQIRIPE